MTPMPCLRCNSMLTYLNRDGECECSWCGHITYKSEPLDYHDRTTKFDTDAMCRAWELRSEGRSWTEVGKAMNRPGENVRKLAGRHLAVCEKCGGVAV